MSHMSQAQWELQQQRQQELIREQARASASNLLSVMRRSLDQVLQRDFVQYIPEEFNEAEIELHRLSVLVETDPVLARDLCATLWTRVKGLLELGANVRKKYLEVRQAEEQAAREAALREAERKRHVRQEAELLWQHELSAWGDRLALSLARPELLALRGNLLGEDGAVSLDGLRSSLHELRIRFEREARDQREQVHRESRQAAVEEFLRPLAERIDSITGEKAQHLKERLDGLRRLPAEEVESMLPALMAEVDSCCVDESVRREMVRAVVNTMVDAGFQVDGPRLIRDGDTDEVLIRGRKPAGSQAEFRIGLNREVVYKFDRYRGSECKADIDQVIPAIQSVYGINLSDERGLWRNPDDRSCDAVPQPTKRRSR